MKKVFMSVFFMSFVLFLGGQVAFASESEDLDTNEEDMVIETNEITPAAINGQSVYWTDNSVIRGVQRKGTFFSTDGNFKVNTVIRDTSGPTANRFLVTVKNNNTGEVVAYRRYSGTGTFSYTVTGAKQGTYTITYSVTPTTWPTTYYYFNGQVID